MTWTFMNMTDWKCLLERWIINENTFLSCLKSLCVMTSDLHRQAATMHVTTTLIQSNVPSMSNRRYPWIRSTPDREPSCGNNPFWWHLQLKVFQLRYLVLTQPLQRDVYYNIIGCKISFSAFWLRSTCKIKAALIAGLLTETPPQEKLLTNIFSM